MAAPKSTDLSNLVKFTTKDSEEVIEAPLSVIKDCGTLVNLIEDAGTDLHIPLPEVTKEIMTMVIAYGARKETEEETFSDLDHETLFELLLAANYLDHRPLLDSLCKAVANMIKGKTPSEIREHFGITQDFTPEEEEQVRKENDWVEERA